jgi:hypothetical protein
VYAGGSYGQELDLCRRYYEKTYPLDQFPLSAGGTGRGEFVTAPTGAVISNNGQLYLGVYPRFRASKWRTPSATEVQFATTSGITGQWTIDGTQRPVRARRLSTEGFWMFDDASGGYTPAATDAFGHWWCDVDI